MQLHRVELRVEHDCRSKRLEHLRALRERGRCLILTVTATGKTVIVKGQFDPWNAGTLQHGRSLTKAAFFPSIKRQVLSHFALALCAA